MDLLIALAERHGEFLTKSDLISRAWPGRLVEDSNLRVQISAIRRALGDRRGSEYVEATSGRGYRFVAHLEPQTIEAAPRERRLPASLTKTIGRDADIAGIVNRLTTARLLTIVGPGGIGKTTLALACARSLDERFADGVAFAEVTSGDDPAMAIAEALGAGFSEETAADALADFIAPLELLVVLDGCECALDASTRLAEATLRRSPRSVVMCTSREALRAEGEVVWRADPLVTPAEAERLSAQEAQEYSAVNLFVDRAAAADRRFTLADSDVATVCNICRRLDGLPLAIQLAASRVAEFGMKGIEAALDSRSHALLQGRRTAMPRHRTLAAAIDWSYDSLTVEAQRAIRCFSLFQGTFDAESAAYVYLGSEAETAKFHEVLGDLVGKGLVMADLSQRRVEYRMLDTTRDYARLKLEAAGELHRMAARHATRTQSIFASADSELELRTRGDWLNHFSRKLEDVRAALDWACALGGDRSLVVPLTLAAIPIWMRLSRLEECSRRIKAALAIAEPESPDEVALGIALGYVGLSFGYQDRQALDICKRAIGQAGRLDDPASQLRATWLLWNLHIDAGNVSRARKEAVCFSELAQRHSGQFEKLMADRAIGVTELLAGNLTAARTAIERVRATSPAWYARERRKWYAYDPDTVARNTLVSLLWLEGKPDSAIALARDNMLRTLQVGDDSATPDVLADAACGMAIMVGDDEAAHGYLDLLDASVRRGHSRAFGQWARIARTALAAGRGDIDPGVALIDEGIDAATRHPRYAIILTELAEKLGASGAQGPARILADQLLRRVQESGEYWILSEVQRIRAQLCDADHEARALLEFALATARSQGARAWELRAATSLAQRWPQAGKELLLPLLGSFTEGHGTRDLTAARQVLDAL